MVGFSGFFGGGAAQQVGKERELTREEDRLELFRQEFLEKQKNTGLTRTLNEIAQHRKDIQSLSSVAATPEFKNNPEKFDSTIGVTIRNLQALAAQKQARINGGDQAAAGLGGQASALIGQAGDVATTLREKAAQPFREATEKRADVRAREGEGRQEAADIRQEERGEERDVDAEQRKLANQLTVIEFKALQKTKSGKTDPETFKQARDLRRDFIKESSEFVDVRNQFSRIRLAGNNPSPVGDIAILFSFMRMLDPASTVREGEIATAKQTTNVPGAIIAKYNQLVNGESLEDGQRQDFVGRAEELFIQQQRFQQRVTSRFSSLAKKFNIDPDAVVADLSEGTPERKFRKGDTATNDKGQKIIFNGAKWVPLAAKKSQ